MSLINKVTYAVKRTAEGSYTNGVHNSGSVTNLTIKGNCQPVSGDDIIQLSEGDRKKQLLKIYTEEELKVNDVVTVDGKPYEAHPAKNYTRQNRLNHYKTILILKDT